MLGVQWAVPIPFVVVAGIYGAQLAVDDAPLDVVAPAFAAGLVMAVELAYWSLDTRDRVRGMAGDDLRRVAYVAALGVGALVASAVLLALADAIRARGLGVDVVGAVAAACALLAVVLFARGRGPTSS
ncbi:MAG TPA: hypothetical protein VFM67_03170 [Gaiella sp.]|nr:hypothetical protein [Gaiella sp.]